MPRTFGFYLESKSPVELLLSPVFSGNISNIDLRSPVPSIENSFIKCASSCLCVFYERTKKQQQQLPVVILTFKTKAVLRQLVIHDLKLSNDSHRYEAYLNKTLVQGFLIF